MTELFNINATARVKVSKTQDVIYFQLLKVIGIGEADVVDGCDVLPFPLDQSERLSHTLQ